MNKSQPWDNRILSLIKGSREGREASLPTNYTSLLLTSRYPEITGCKTTFSNKGNSHSFEVWNDQALPMCPMQADTPPKSSDKKSFQKKDQACQAIYDIP